MTTVFFGLRRIIMLETSMFREALYREVCRLHENLLEGWTIGCI